jgi:hypothetical protein
MLVGHANDVMFDPAGPAFVFNSEAAHGPFQRGVAARAAYFALTPRRVCR